MTRSDAREIAFKAIFAYINNKDNFDLDKTIEIARKEQSIDAESYEFITSIIKEFIDNFEEMKAQIDSHSGEFVYARIYKVDLALIYLALTEISYIHTPVKVVINEVLNLAKAFSTNDSPKYINGVLASIIKDMGL